MSLSDVFNLRRTLAFRLVLWYSAIFIISTFCLFLVLYTQIVSVIDHRTDESLLEEFDELSRMLTIKGVDDLKILLTLEAESEGTEEVFFRVLNPDGSEIYSTDMTSWSTLTTGPVPIFLKEQNFQFETSPIPDRQHAVRILRGLLQDDTIMEIGMSTKGNDLFLEKLRYLFGTLFAIFVVLAFLIGWFMARRALNGLEDVTRTAQHIASGAFERRVPDKERGAEIEQLTSTFNTMLDRIHLLLKGMRDQTDAMAHDLRSPLTRIRGVAEMTLTTESSLEEYKSMAANTIEESDRLLEMINTMMDISAVEYGIDKVEREDIDLTAVIEDACGLFAPVAENKDISIQYSLPPSTIISGDLARVQRLVANLLDNALKYTPSYGRVVVGVVEAASELQITFTDNGIGISEDDLPYIFKRFYRCDHSRTEPGTGLGLSLALAIAHFHGGDITVSSTLQQGSTFTVHLPRPGA